MVIWGAGAGVGGVTAVVSEALVSGGSNGVALVGAALVAAGGGAATRGGRDASGGIKSVSTS